MTIPDRDLLISAPQLFVWRLRQWARKIRGLHSGHLEASHPTRRRRPGE